MIIINNIKTGIDDGDAVALRSAFHRLKGINQADIGSSFVIKKSLDARHKGRPVFVYSVGICLNNPEDEEPAVRLCGDPQLTVKQKTKYEPICGNLKLNARPVVVGFGPAGMFAGLLLAKYGYRPIIIERGASVDERTECVRHFFADGSLDLNSNIQFGEGGAGTFSDGKLTTRIGDPRCERVLEEFVDNGAPKEILYTAKPHIGTDNLRHVVKSIRERIIGCGGEVLFNTRLDDIKLQNGRIKSISVINENGVEEIETGALIIAIGHSARDTFNMLLASGFVLEPKPFSVGVRIEHLQSDIDKALYGELAGHPALPPGEYQLSLRRGDRAVYTFCMCPGGSVVAAASEAGGIVTNGMSLYARDGKNANAALAVSVSPADYGISPLAGMEFQRRLERAAFNTSGSFKAPVQTAGAFLGGKGKTGRILPTYPIGVTEAKLDDILPGYVTGMLKLGLRVFGQRMSGFDAEDALLTGVETRTSSPVRITRSTSFEAIGLCDIYPAGEGAGYAGGIMSAAVDGLRTAEAVISKYAPF